MYPGCELGGFPRQVEFAMSYESKFRVKPGKKLRLRDIDPKPL
jgi:hypothetical protein